MSDPRDTPLLGSDAAHTPPEPEPAPIVTPNLFAQTGVFTAWDPLAALNMPAKFTAVAIRPDICTVDQAAQLRARYRTLAVWEDRANEGQAAVDRFHADLYIAQTEVPHELAAAEKIENTITVPKGQVGNLFSAGWTPLLECYRVVVPSDLGEGFAVVECDDGSPDYAWYLASLNGRPHWVYLAEEFH